MLNQAQVMGILRAVVPAAIAFAVGKGWIPSADSAGITNSILTLAAALGAATWAATSRTDNANIKAVAANPDVAQIVIKPSAVDGTAAAAADPTLTKVVAQ